MRALTQNNKKAKNELKSKIGIKKFLNWNFKILIFETFKIKKKTKWQLKIKKLNNLVF